MCCLRFSCDWIAERGDNLDISWLKDEREDDNGDLPEPAILIQEAMGELEAEASRFCKSTWRLEIAATKPKFACADCLKTRVGGFSLYSPRLPVCG
jgi:hypothetical protein